MSHTYLEIRIDPPFMVIVTIGKTSLGPSANSDPLIVYIGWTLKIKTHKIMGLNDLTYASLDPLPVRAG